MSLNCDLVSLHGSAMGSAHHFTEAIYLSSGTELINFDHYLRWVGGWLNLEFSIKLLLFIYFFFFLGGPI